MKYKYNILSRSKWSVLYWGRPSKKVLFLVPAAFLCLLCITVLSLDCFSTQDQSYLCPIFFNNPSAFRPVEYNIKASTVREEHHVLLDTDSLVSPAADNNNHNALQEDDVIDVSELQRKIDAENDKQTIWNLKTFGPITSDTIIIVIQAHRRVEYMQALIKCLEGAKYIEQALLVFSHGFYSEEINNVVQSIQFAPVLQIFFPYSLQTHPNTFPGFSPNDCPHGMKEENKIKCRGRPRDVKSLQVKHHWWWKVNMVFSGLRITRKFNGLVFFLEEDHYILPDFLHVLRLMRQEAPEKCPDCNIYGLGLNPKVTTVDDYRGWADKVHVVQWNNMGFAFDRQFWAGLNSQKCSRMFCEYNDYNWDFTLAYLSHKCLPQELKPLNVVSSRVFHIGDCGMHFHSKNCSAQKSLKLVQSLEKNVTQFLFPPQLTVLSTYYRQFKVDGHNGGWDDPRDIQLCKNISQQLHW